MDELSGKPHFPPPLGPLKGERTVNPRRRLAPLLPPPKLVLLPTPLPQSVLRKCAFTATHTLSVHIIPAAYPRAGSPPDRVEAKEDRKKWLKATMDRMFWEKKEAEKVFPDPKANIRVAEEGIWGTLLRIRRNRSVADEVIQGPKGITLIATHPIGFHKEIWEPTFQHLIEMTENSSSRIRIDEIWSIEAVNHGDAALLNGLHIPKLPDRSDYGRDIANFVIYHLPEARDALGKDLPLKLPRLSNITATSRVKNGFTDRHVIAMGHSLGGDATALAGISYPKLFNSLILMETTLYPVSNSGSKRKPAIFMSTIGRRSSWPSKEEAKKAFLKAPMFQKFDPAVLHAYVEHGLYEDKTTGEARLKCNPAWEASEFAEVRTMNEGWELLPTLSDNVGLRWVMGGREDASDLVGGPKVAALTVWRRPKNNSNVLIPGAGHLVVQEKPKEVAEDIKLFLTHELVTSRKEQSKL
ncbi:hypothetical protein M413DRAFT_442215 [Hebeloma cylindrosporum]|uniref:AB hydrolase-1 domain-containing protein n=1 Tax=Hebeloma cylindrosporum TaxID=76867 RepID=A0A0C2YX26_HEBCY|nr:hypothetical protein M413DRAFT_442215 [Hebeloma cylindrosporum h7]